MNFLLSELITKHIQLVAVGLSRSEGALDVVNPETRTTSSLIGTIAIIANSVILIVVAASIFFIIRGAFEWIRGDAKKGQAIVTNAVLGIIVAVIAFFLVQLAVGAGSALGTGLNSNL